MECGLCTITVYFEDPFWVGLYEREDETGYQVSKIMFGAEPKDYEVYETLLNQWVGLRFSPLCAKAERCPRIKNPKRERHEIRRRIKGSPVGTKAQEALKAQYVSHKKAVKAKSIQEQEAEEKRRFLLRQAKKKQKHRGH